MTSQKKVWSWAAGITASLLVNGLLSAQTARDRDRDIQIYDQHITTIASPYFEGRAPGSKGNALAAEYIQWNFERLGFGPPFPSETEAADGSTVLTPQNSFRQTFAQGYQLKATHRSVKVTSDAGESRELEPFSEATVLEYSGSGRRTGKISGPLAFVGYSIESGSDGYTSYAEEDDLTGKIALILRFEPLDDDGKSRWAMRGWTPAASLSRKLSAAEARGAAGVIVVNPPDVDDPRVGELMDIDSGTTGVEGLLNIPAVMVSANVADWMVRVGDFEERSLQDLREVADAMGDEGSTAGAIDMPGVRVDLDVRVERVPVETDNVGGVLPGKGELADEYIIIGAHYDHVGYGEFGSRAPARAGEVHPGADDNGSGTSGMLLAAEKIAGVYEDLPDAAQARSILFLAFSAEESGLNGSRHFVGNMPFEQDALFTMINMDMIGRVREDRLELEGLDTGDRMQEIVGEFVDASGLAIATRKPSGNSDHASFRAKKIPILNFHTGLHNEYHTPDDTSSLINREGAVRVVELATDAALALALDTGDMVYTRPGSRAAEAEEQTDEETDEQTGEAAIDEAEVIPEMAEAFGAVVSDDDSEEPGLLIVSVETDSTAEQTGVKAGDHLIRWSGVEITTRESWYEVIEGNNPGDLVELFVTRDGKPLRLHAILSGG